MATLYTINGFYPNKNFAFTLTPTELGLAEINHEHSLGSIMGLIQALASLSNTNHGHTAVPNIKISNITLTGSVALVGSGTLTVTAANGVVTIGTTPVQTSVVGGLVNANPNRRHGALRFFVGENQQTTSSDEVLVFTGDTNVTTP